MQRRRHDRGLHRRRCAQHSVRLHALEAMESGHAAAPADPARRDPRRRSVRRAPSRWRTTACPAARSRSSSSRCCRRRACSWRATRRSSPRCEALGPDVGLKIVAAQDITDGVLAPTAGDLALVVAAHGNDEVATLRAGLEAGVRYVGLVASRKRGAAVIEELRAEGVAEELLDALDTPAGLDIGARTPAEVALRSSPASSRCAARVRARRRQPSPRDRSAA